MRRFRLANRRRRRRGAASDAGMVFRYVCSSVCWAAWLPYIIVSFHMDFNSLFQCDVGLYMYAIKRRTRLISCHDFVAVGDLLPRAATAEAPSPNVPLLVTAPTPYRPPTTSPLAGALVVIS